MEGSCSVGYGKDMSRIGRKPIEVPGFVTAHITGNELRVAGPKGELTRNISSLLKVAIRDKEVVVSRLGESRLHRSLHGLTRTLIANMIEGVASGFEKKLEMHGVGYRAEVKDRDIVLRIGFSHPVHYSLSEGVDAIVAREEQITRIRLTGINKEKLSDVAARLRAILPPEPYKGKGIRYEGEVIRRKAGKTKAIVK
ncbi:MAG: 50S ribosomal protein L6 [Syntrophomonadaceae bacterium]|nr:50S ribosomal protein L6 [Bacillota bacterium]MBT9138166.1 50S ribosomal protein L6 [Bacillota bacterium]MBT9146839.1 50S ribosomal protein L6 [Bacillota bacterium]